MSKVNWYDSYREKPTKFRDTLHKHRSKLTLGLVAFFLLNAVYYVGTWQQTKELAYQAAASKRAADKVSEQSISQGWVAQYVDQHAFNSKNFATNPALDEWVSAKINAEIAAISRTTMVEVVAAAQKAASDTTGRPTNSSSDNEGGSRSQTPALSAGDGISIEGSRISVLPPSSLNGASTIPSSIGLTSLATNGCATRDVLKFDGGRWVCAIDQTIEVPNSNGTTQRIAVFSSSGTIGNSYLMQDTTGLWVDAGKDLHVDGIVYGDGSGLTEINGRNLQAGSVQETSLQAGSISERTIADGAVTGGKLATGSVTSASIADSAITLGKLSGAGCADGQIIQRAGAAWSCAYQVDQDTHYAAGDGLALNGTVMSLNTSNANDWGGTQTFSSLRINGSTYTGLGGDGLVTSNGLLAAALGTSISTAELENSAVTGAKIADGAISLSKLGQSGCVQNQVMTWDGAQWACVDIDTIVPDEEPVSYTAGAGLALNGNDFSLDRAYATTWTGVQTFANGLRLNGATYSDLTGDGLSFSNGTLKTTLGTSIESSEITDGAISDSKLAAGAIGFNKIGANGCTSGQTIRWSGTAWTCATDNNAAIVYSAGNGLSLNDTTFSLNTASANTWSATQSFGSGLTVGGATYTNLAGTGLSFGGGALSSVLGTSIESGEILDGTIIAADLADNAVASSKILDGSIISADLSDSAVTSAKILDGTISGTDIASGTITASNIADGAITASKLSASARKRVVTSTISIAASLLSTQEQAVFIPPTSGTITKVSFTSGNNLLAISTGGTISVERKTAAAGTVASMNLSQIGFTAMSPVAPTLGAGTAFSAGDLYTFKYAPGVLGLALNNLLISIEYIANE